MNKTPAVRFKGFTEDWEQRKLCEITTEKLTNGVMNYRSVEPTDVRHINVINMYTSDEIHIDELSFSAYDDSVLNKCNVEFGDVFLTRSSLKPEGIAEPNVLLANGRFVFDDHLIRMKINKKKYDPCFIKICLETRHIKEQFIKSSKTTAFTTIGQDDIAECIGFFPDITEQKSLALIFSSIDKLITLHQRKYEKLVNIKKSMLYKMFPQNGNKVPEIRFTGFTDEWEQRKFSELAETRRGLTYNPSNIRDSGIRVLRSSNIAEDQFTYGEDDVFVEPDAANIPYANRGDILITSANGSTRLVGKHAIIRDIPDNSAVHGGFMLLARANNSEFVNALMSAPWYSKFISLYVAGGNGAIGNLNKNDLDEQDVLVPEDTEQKAIGQYFEQLDNLITLHQRKLEKLKQLKQAMLHKMFV